METPPNHSLVYSQATISFPSGSIRLILRCHAMLRQLRVQVPKILGPDLMDSLSDVVGLVQLDLVGTEANSPVDSPVYKDRTHMHQSPELTFRPGLPPLSSQPGIVFGCVNVEVESAASRNLAYDSRSSQLQERP